MSEDTKITTIPSHDTQVRQLEKFIKYLIDKLGGSVDVILTDVNAVDITSELIVDSSEQGILRISLDSMYRDVTQHDNNECDDDKATTPIKLIDAQDTALAQQKLQYWNPDEAN